MIIRPYEGVGPVSFGMTRDQVRRSVASKVEAYYKSPQGLLPTDAFDSIGMHGK